MRGGESIKNNQMKIIFLLEKTKVYKVVKTTIIIDITLELLRLISLTICNLLILKGME